MNLPREGGCRRGTLAAPWSMTSPIMLLDLGEDGEELKGCRDLLGCGGSPRWRCEIQISPNSNYNIPHLDKPYLYFNTFPPLNQRYSSIPGTTDAEEKGFLRGKGGEIFVFLVSVR
ncbi:hypothetical protein JTE90_004534 [Oedothorax gibbosus]|uniref:Uncharacterized protein n=1 Tax=Oedothorax gibbosus TaxID=931172 RepID=A0AAV6VF84_9ARAC|nr:hypothetical protein JTE90_004534 [Oedothorax gibbosus]